MPKKIIKRLAVGILLLVVLAGLAFGAYKLFFDPYRGTLSQFVVSQPLDRLLTQVQAREDLDFILKRLGERHPATLRGIPAPVMEQYQAEIAALPEQVSVLELWRAASRITARMQDGHTATGYNSPAPHSLPISFKSESGEFFVRDGELAGSRLIAIEGKPIQELYQRYLPHASFELEQYAAYRFARGLPQKDFLEFIGVDTSATAIQLVFATPAGEKTQVLSFQPPSDPQPQSAPQPPPFVSYQIDSAAGLGILTLNQCLFNEFYQNTLRAFFQEVKDQGIHTIAVDLRHNGGGNSRVVNEFLRYLDVDTFAAFGGSNVRLGPYLSQYTSTGEPNDRISELTYTGKIYILTSVETFSSATDFAASLSDNRLAEIVGETSGNMPTSYGDILSFQTPHAGLVFRVSHKQFFRVDRSKDDLPLTPDYEVPAEEALEKVYELVR